MENNGTAKHEGEKQPQARDGVQWQTIGPALGLFAVSVCLAFARRDAAPGLQERMLGAVATAFAIALVTMLGGTMLFKIMNIVPSGKALVAFWVVVMAGWWWFTR